MTVSNTSDEAVTAQLEEPIPVQVAPDPGSVAFTSPVTPLTTNPLVVWDLNLPPHGHDVVSYQASEVASGVSKHRLMAYVRAYDKVSSQQTLERIARPGLVTRVWTKPIELRLKVGQARQLTLHGRLYNGKLAPLSDLTGAVWTTANPDLVTVNRSGRVLGLSPGKVLVWAQLGGIRAQTVVVVNRAGRGHTVATPPSDDNQPPVQSSTAPSPSSSSPAPTSPAPTSGTAPPTSAPPTSGTPSPPAEETPGIRRAAGPVIELT